MMTRIVIRDSIIITFYKNIHDMYFGDMNIENIHVIIVFQ